MVPLLLVTLLIFFWLLEGRLFDQSLPKNRNVHAKRNLLLNVLNLIVLAGANILILRSADLVQRENIGLFMQLSFGIPIVVQFIFYDLINYFIHRGLHASDFFWRIHRGHHSDPYLDVTSAFRFHPFESIFRVVIQGFVVIAFGIDIAAVVAYQFFVIVALLFSHANIRIDSRVERWFGWVLVLPSIHRFHHSQERHEHDANFGIGLMIWDHLFGTYLKPKPVNDFVIGLQEYRQDDRQTPGAILKDPFAISDRKRNEEAL